MNFAVVMEKAVQLQATDIHLQSRRRPVFRVGQLLQESSFPEMDSALIGQWLQYMDGEMRTENGMTDRTMAFDWRGQIRCRIHVFTEQSGCHAAIRILYPPDQLGPDPDEVLLRRLCSLKDGLILVTGATGSGKTTTLWRMMKYLNTHRPCHIVTLEDPIEYILKGKMALISQREETVHFHTFQEGVRQALRQDPDILLIGEMRDEATMEAALTAAETGHLVLSTLHTRSAAQSVTRLVSAFSSFRQEEVRCRLALVLQGILSQRRLCKNGQTHIAREILLHTPAVGQLIRSSREHQLQTIIQTSGALGMKTMEQALAAVPF